MSARHPGDPLSQLTRVELRQIARQQVYTLRVLADEFAEEVVHQLLHKFGDYCSLEDE